MITLKEYSARDGIRSNDCLQTLPFESPQLLLNYIKGLEIKPDWRGYRPKQQDLGEVLEIEFVPSYWEDLTEDESLFYVIEGTHQEVEEFIRLMKRVGLLS